MTSKLYSNLATGSDAELLIESSSIFAPSVPNSGADPESNDHELDEFNVSVPINSTFSDSDNSGNPHGGTNFTEEDGNTQYSRYRDSIEATSDNTWAQYNTGPLPKLKTSTRSLWERIIQGPEIPRESTVTPVIKSLQLLPSRLNAQLPPTLLKAGLMTFLILWGFLFYQLNSNSLLEPANVDGKPVQLVGCGAVGEVWKGINEACGINGELCGPFDNRTFLFKCPASCAKGSWTYGPRPVGNFSSIYQSYVIGGDNMYRADSSICGAGVHQGAISNRKGGCARIRFKGMNTNGFESKAGKGGIQSIEFDSFFPASFSFDSYLIRETEWVDGCSDLRFFIIGVNIVLSLIFGYFVVSPQLFFWALSFMGFWTVIFVSDPPVRLEGDTQEIWSNMISLGFRRLLPTAITCFVIYHFCVSKTLTNLEASMSRSLFWVGGFWLGLLENYTFESLPVDRLIISDINKQPGGWVAVIFMLVLVITASANQAYTIWYSGKFKSYMILYGCFIGGIFAITFIPNQTLRIHHYFIALVLLPGTSFQTTPSLLYQGILMGLFLSGVARWDFDSILQTTEQLRRDGPSLIGGIPSFISFNATSGVILWKAIDDNTPTTIRDIEKFGDGGDNYTPASSSQIYQSSHVTESISNPWPLVKRDDSESVRLPPWDGFSLIANDIEIYRGTETSFDLTPYLELAKNTNGKKLYLRIAYVILNDWDLGDYTKAGILTFENKTWSWNEPESGPFGT